MIAAKYRYLHPSMIGVVDLNVSSNSDVGMSGSFVPYAKLYDGFYFTPEKEPCQNRYLFDKSLQEYYGISRGVDTSSFENYVKELEDAHTYDESLGYEKIEIVEKVPDEMENQ